MKKCVNRTCARDLADDTEVCGKCGTRQPLAESRSASDTGGRRNQAVGDTSADRGGIAQGGAGNVQQNVPGGTIYNIFVSGAPTSPPVPTSTPTRTPTPVLPPVFQAKWGSEGSGDGRFQNPRGVAVDGAGNVYMADMINHRIQKFSPQGAFLAKWGSKGSGDGQFNEPWDVAVDGAGNVYVAETGNHRVQKFSPQGAFLAKWGSQGGGDGQFRDPRGVAVDKAGNVYVADTGNDRIQKFGQR